MCFSAEASFGASAVLGTIGVLAIRKTTNRQQLLFAAIPIFFSIQQFSEGLVWLSLLHPAREIPGQVFAYIFVVFALLVWPVWLPLSIWLLEDRPRIKRFLMAAVGFGVTFAGLVGFYLFSHSLFPEIKEHHIHYSFGFSDGLAKNASLLYFIPTIIPPFLSSRRKVQLLGFFLLFSYLVSKFYFAQAVVSVWCFLGAFISFIVLWALIEMREKERPDRQEVILVED